MHPNTYPTSNSWLEANLAVEALCFSVTLDVGHESSGASRTVYLLASSPTEKKQWVTGINAVLSDTDKEAVQAVQEARRACNGLGIKIGTQRRRSSLGASASAVSASAASHSSLLRRLSLGSMARSQSVRADPGDDDGLAMNTQLVLGALQFQPSAARRAAGSAR